MLSIARWKDRDGRARDLTAAEFRRVFGIDYAARLIAPSDLPESFLKQCASLPRGLVPDAEALTYISWIDEGVGWGLFADRDLWPDEVVGEYAGILSRDWSSDVKTTAEINPYLLKFPFESPYAIDAARCGNATRFANHSLKNTNVRREYVFDGVLPRVLFVVDRPISGGAQVLLDYGPTYWLDRTPTDF